MNPWEEDANERYEEKWASLMNAVDTGWCGAENKFFDEIADKHSIKDIYELRDREPEIKEKLTKLLKEQYEEGFEWDKEYWVKWFFGDNWFPQEKEDGSICVEFTHIPQGWRRTPIHYKHEYRDLNHWEEENYGEHGEGERMPYYAWWKYPEW